MNHLVPVQRPDKNGKVVTRHVKQNGSGDVTQKDIPSPAMALNDERSRVLSHVGNMISDHENEVKIADLDEVTQDHLINLGDHLNLSADAAVLWKIMNPRGYTKGRFLDAADMPPIAKEIRQLALFHSMDKGIALIETLSFARGLDTYTDSEGFNPENDEQSKALIDVSIEAQRMLQEEDIHMKGPSYDETEDYVDNEDLYLSGIGGDYDDRLLGQMWLRNKKLVELVVSRPKDSDRIIEIIQSRKTVQPGTIEALLDFGAHDSLSSGAL